MMKNIKIFIESLSIDPKNFKDSIEYNEIQSGTQLDI